jgi:hypothetical protein
VEDLSSERVGGRDRGGLFHGKAAIRETAGFRSREELASSAGQVCFSIRPCFSRV